MSTQSFNSVSEMMEGVTDDTQFREAVKKRIRSRQIVKTLVAMRVSKGVSQLEVAKELGSSQSRVSKLEAGEDENLTFKELRAYLKALNQEVELVFAPRGLTLYERVKYYAFKMRDSIVEMVRLAKNDDQIVQGVAHAHVEILLNVARMLRQTSQQLPVCPDNGKPYINIADCEISIEEGEHPQVKKISSAVEPRARSRQAVTC